METRIKINNIRNNGRAGFVKVANSGGYTIGSFSITGGGGRGAKGRHDLENVLEPKKKYF